MTETTRRQFKQHTNRQRVKQSSQCEDNTAKDVQNFIDNNKYHEGTDDDQCYVVDGDISAERTQILFASHNATKSLTCTDEVVSWSDGTCKLDSNEHQMTAIGIADKQQKFHPAAFVSTLTAMKQHFSGGMKTWKKNCQRSVVLRWHLGGQRVIAVLLFLSLWVSCFLWFV